MTDENNATQTDSSADGENTTTEGGDQTSNEEKGKREDRRAEHDFLRFKQEARQLRDENQKLQEQMERSKQEQLVSQSRFKEAYEVEKNRAAELETKLKSTKDTFWNGLKNQEVKTQAIKLGIRDEALVDLDLLNHDGVDIETTSHGNVNILGANEYVEKLKMVRPHWFKDNSAPNFNNSVPTETKPKEFSPIDMLKLQRENPKKYKELMQKRFK